MKILHTKCSAVSPLILMQEEILLNLTRSDVNSLSCTAYRSYILMWRLTLKIPLWKYPRTQYMGKIAPVSKKNKNIVNSSSLLPG